MEIYFCCVDGLSNYFLHIDATTSERNRSDSIETSAMDQPAFMERVTVAAVLYICIREVHGSLFGQDTQFPD
jgi:hypothetical protein